MKKIIICGGHHNSALVVAEELIKRSDQVFWFGHKYSMIGDKNPSAEYLEVTRKEIPFIEIKAGKFQRKFRFWQNIFRIPVGFWQSLKALRRIKPDLILSFGGYLALPVAIVGYLLGIPIVTHEQTTVSGIANRLIAKVAKKIFITFESSAKYYPREKVVFTGLPVRKEIFGKREKLFFNDQRTIYITGGKQGAHFINEAVFKVLPQLMEKFNIIHQCGSASQFNDYEKALKIKSGLGDKQKNYLVKEYFFPEEIGSVFNSADFLVSRAGAHTVYELMVLNKPAILIPIPWSNRNEQEENAKMLVSFGLAKILSQKDLEQGKLLETILEFDRNLEKYQLKKDLPFLKEPAEKIISREIKNILS